MHPTLLHIGHVSLPTFGALAALGLVLALVLSERTAVIAGVDPVKLWDAGIFAVIAVFVLSRALLVAEHWKTFVAYPMLLLAVPSLTATGLLLTGVATTIWLWSKRMPMARALDAWAPCAALIWACLGLGHMAEGSDPGMPIAGGTHTHPVGLYVAVLAMALVVGSYAALRRRVRQVAGYTLASAGLGQFVISFVRQPGTTFVGGLDLLQWVALGMVFAGLGLTAARSPRVIDNTEGTGHAL